MIAGSTCLIILFSSALRCFGHAKPAAPTIMSAGDLCVDLVRRVVTVRNEEVKFSPREYEVLRLMVAHAGKVLTHR